MAVFIEFTILGKVQGVLRRPSAALEVGVTEPTATFSACFGAPFLVWHPIIYAEMLAMRLKQHTCDA